MIYVAIAGWVICACGWALALAGWRRERKGREEESRVLHEALEQTRRSTGFTGATRPDGAGFTGATQPDLPAHRRTH